MGLEIIAFLAGLIGAISTIPQIYQMIKTKEVSSISTQMFMMKNCAYGLWMTFGYFSASAAIILWNLFALVMSTAVVVMKYKILAEAKQPTAKIIQMDFSQDEVQEETRKPHLKLVYSRSK